jgi:hypothetical protein
MKRNTWTCCTLALALASPAAAQDQAPEIIKPPERTERARKPVTPLKVLIVLSKFKGEAKVGSLPYTLPCNTDERATNLRMGIEVPIAMAGKEGMPPLPLQYKNVGTNIDCRAAALEDGRFRLELTVEHSSIYTPSEPQPRPVQPDAPLFRSFRSAFVPILRDGQTQQYTVATDPVSGEVVKIDVTLTALK